MPKKIISILATVIFSVLVGSGIVYAATRDITSRLGGAANDVFVLSGGLQVNRLKAVGTTFLTGGILNNSTTNGVDNPLIFGDNVRIDGRVYRGSTAGSSDNKPFIVNDNLEVLGNITAANATLTSLSATSLSATSLTVNGEAVGAKKTYEATIDTTANGDEIVSVASGTICIPDTNSKYYKYHYKKIAIPEMTISDLPNLRGYCHAHATSSFSTALPNSRDVWIGCSLYYSEGYGYLLYKYEIETCAGSISSTIYYFDGQYKIIIY